MVNKITILVAMLAGLFLGCASSNQEITLTVEVKGEVPEALLYTVPLDGISFWGFRDTVTPDPDGRFHIRTISNKPALVALFTGKGGRFYDTWDLLLVEPGKHYEVLMDKEAEPTSMMINDNQCKAQALLQTFPNHAHPQMDELWHLHDSAVDIIRNTVNLRLQEELLQLDGLLEQDLVSPEAHEMLSYTRRFYHLYVMNFLASMKYLTPLFHGEDSSDEQALALWLEAGFSPEDTWFFSAPQAFDFLSHYSWGQLYYHVGYTEAAQVQRNHIERGLRHTRNLEIAETYLEPEAMAFFKATYLFFHAYQQRYEKELITLYETYQTTYPRSDYLPFLNPLIEGVIDFHAKADEGLSAEMHILDNYNEISSFEELVAPFHGRRVYLDVWATWCGPCKREFAHMEDLKAVLQEKDILMLYISTDHDSDDEQWKNMIKYYNLEGYHVRAGNALKSELNTLLGIQGIPHFALVDDRGKILIPKAHRPSELEALKQQLGMD